MTPALLAAAAAAAAFLAAPAPAQEAEPADAAAAAGDDSRVNQLLVYGDDTCPPSTEEEIIVCARLPEEERFRIPRALRQNPNDPASRSWGDRAIELSYVGRSGIGSCSPAGAGGFIGCHNELIRQARAERRDAATSTGPGWSRKRGASAAGASTAPPRRSSGRSARTINRAARHSWEQTAAAIPFSAKARDAFPGNWRQL